jgi:hypothetical protein
VLRGGSQSSSARKPMLDWDVGGLRPAQYLADKVGGAPEHV